jgi:hypothetical protein
VIQAQIQTNAYWGPEFKLTESDIEQIYNHLLEVERPQTIQEIARVIIAHRVQQSTQQIKKQLAGRAIYQPQNSYTIDQELVFPQVKFAHGTVTAVREGYNPEYGKFDVIRVNMNSKSCEFAAGLTAEHPLNFDDEEEAIASLIDVDLEALVKQQMGAVIDNLQPELEKRPEFVRLGQEWFVKALMAEVNIGHLHLAEAVLEINEGGPLSPDEILPHLDMDEGIDKSVQRFSLNYALQQDKRFDEIAPKGEVAWFLHRLEPEGVRQTPDRLVYESIPYDRPLLNPQLLALERELDDEWSDIKPLAQAEAVQLTLIYPHRWAGTLPLNSRTRPLFPPSRSPRQRVIFLDAETEEEIVAWVVQEQRYIYGLADWYEEHKIPVGGYIRLSPGPEADVVMLDYGRRRAQREWVRLAHVVDNRLQFELMRRSIGCDYDDLMVVGTDVVAAVDALWRRAESHQRSVASLLGEIFSPLASLTPQKTVHAKTLYSAINMLRRVPPGPLFAELVRHQAFQAVGDHYWQFDRERWQEERN